MQTFYPKSVWGAWGGSVTDRMCKESLIPKVSELGRELASASILYTEKMKFRNPKRLASQQVGNRYPTSAVQRRKARLLSPPGFHPLDRLLRRKEPFVLMSYHQCNTAADQESIWLDPLNTEGVYKGIVLYPLTKQKELVSSVHSTLTEYPLHARHHWNGLYHHYTGSPCQKGTSSELSKNETTHPFTSLIIPPITAPAKGFKIMKSTTNIVDSGSPFFCHFCRTRLCP